MNKQRIWNLKNLKEGDWTFSHDSVEWGAVSICALQKYKGKPGFYLYGAIYRVVSDVPYDRDDLYNAHRARLYSMCQTICSLTNEDKGFDFNIGKRAKVSTWEKKLRKAGLIDTEVKK